MEIDLLKMEIDGNLPHWLSPSQRFPDMKKETLEEMRKRYRDAWLAKRKELRNGKSS